MSEESLIEYPCRFPIKIMGRACDELKISITEIIGSHVPETDIIEIKHRASKESNYHAYTVTITATSREQLDNIYIALSSNEYVIMAL